jgi:hypothetical protein
MRNDTVLGSVIVLVQWIHGWRGKIDLATAPSWSSIGAGNLEACTARCSKSRRISLAGPCDGKKPECEHGTCLFILCLFRSVAKRDAREAA